MSCAGRHLRDRFRKASEQGWANKMADITPDEMASKLQVEGFSQSSPIAPTLNDPIADTPMMVTLDELHPYELNPRLTRNPLYDEIKASIQQRGLDAPPPITRRPDADHYVIRNGGNTRLAILRELWSETRDEQFFRILCLFRPWSERGEIVALTGHLAENELRGRLTFIERALGVEKAREIYEQETGKTLSQSELARRLAADGFPVPQSHISRMSDAVSYLLPAIPTVLYAGLGRHQVERLSVMRKSCERTWDHYAKAGTLSQQFDSVFHDVLSQFDTSQSDFSAQRVQDEMIGQMSDMLGIDYDVLVLDLSEADSRHRALVSDPEPVSNLEPRPEPAVKPGPNEAPPAAPEPSITPLDSTVVRSSPEESKQGQHPASPEEMVEEHIVPPPPTTERLQSIQRMVADQLGDEPLSDFSDSDSRSMPDQAAGVYPVADIWCIEPSMDSPEQLRIHLARFAREIAGQDFLGHCIEGYDHGIGFMCKVAEDDMPQAGKAVLGLLVALSSQPTLEEGRAPAHLVLPSLLYGQGAEPPYLSDNSLVKLFRLIRLARRLRELECDHQTTVSE